MYRSEDDQGATAGYRTFLCHVYIIRKASKKECQGVTLIMPLNQEHEDDKEDPVVLN